MHTIHILYIVLLAGDDLCQHGDGDRQAVVWVHLGFHCLHPGQLGHSEGTLWGETDCTEGGYHFLL